VTFVRVLLLVLIAVAPVAAAAPPTPPAPWLLDQVKTLAAPELEGRASGTPGAERAAHHIAAELQRLGLRAVTTAPGCRRSRSRPACAWATSTH
jgi:hypothetical protein